MTAIGACNGGRYPVLVLPVGEPVQIDLTSVDVLHAFWVPFLDVKMDAFPGHVDRFTVTLDRERRWIGRCAQFCGLLPLRDGLLDPVRDTSPVQPVAARPGGHDGGYGHMMPEPTASAQAGQAAAVSPVASEPPGLVGWLLTSHHKRIGILILTTGFITFLFDRVLGACPAPVIAITFPAA